MPIDQIAAEFVKRYEAFWNAGATDVASIYTADAILCGYEIVKSSPAVSKALLAIISQGWSEIKIEVVEALEAGNSILLACKYTAKSAKDTMEAKSSYALVEDNGIWKVAMHTAT